jgi:rubredoxin
MLESMLVTLFPQVVLFIVNFLLLLAVYIAVHKLRAQITDHISQLFSVQQNFLEEAMTPVPEKTPLLPSPYRIPGEVDDPEQLEDDPEKRQGSKPAPKSSLDQWQHGWECPRCGADEDQVEIVPHDGDSIQEKAKWMCIHCGSQWESEPIYETADKKMLCYKCNKELMKRWYCSEHGSLLNDKVEEHNSR